MNSKAVKKIIRRHDNELFSAAHGMKAVQKGGGFLL